MDSRSHLKFDRMPREVANLAVAVNRAFERVGELMASQKVLTSGIAHEIRTPLAAMKLELGHIDHPRARQAEADLDELVHFIGQLTTLARLDSFDHGMFEAVDLVELSSSVVAQLAPWTYENNHSLEFSRQVDVCVVQGVPALLKDALRNLIENAVRHTPDHTRVIVRVGSGIVDVEDRSSERGSQRPATDKPADSLGIGLKIVSRIAEIHGASLRQSSSKTGRIFGIEF